MWKTRRCRLITPYSCDKCVATYDGLASYEVHVAANHIKNDPHSNTLSDETLAEEQSLPHETKTLEDSNEREWRNQATSFSGYIHQTTKNSFTCKFCDKKYQSKLHLMMHSQIHISMNRNVCVTSSSQKSDPKRHTGGKRFKCNVCTSSFHRKSCLIRHMMFHTGEKPFNCDECDLKFTQKGNLIAHKNVHTGDRLFKCDECASSFTCKMYLKRHQKIHTGKKSYKCGICTLNFVRKDNLNTHQMIHTGEKPHTCDVCNRSFTQKGNLNLHKKRHALEKPYKCDVCPVSFNAKWHLTVHKRVHTGESHL